VGEEELKLEMEEVVVFKLEEMMVEDMTEAVEDLMEVVEEIFELKLEHNFNLSVYNYE